jgi:hypothetical protein
MNAKNKAASLVEDILSHARSIYPLIGRAVTNQPAIWSSVSRASTDRVIGWQHRYGY